MNKDTVKVCIEHSIPVSRISDLLVLALEGGSNYWYEIVGDNKAQVPECEYLAQLPLYEKGWLDLIDYVEGSRKEARLKTPFRLNREAVMMGLAIMAEHYPQAAMDFISEQDDATTGDVFLQCCVFGEVIYG